MYIFLFTFYMYFLSSKELHLYARFYIFVNTLQDSCVLYMLSSDLLYKWLWYERVDLHMCDI